MPNSLSFVSDTSQLVENAAGIFLQLKRGQKRGGDGENAAFRSELFSPPPGLKAIKEWNCELRKEESLIINRVPL